MLIVAHYKKPFAYTITRSTTKANMAVTVQGTYQFSLWFFFDWPYLSRIAHIAVNAAYGLDPN